MRPHSPKPIPASREARSLEPPTTTSSEAGRRPGRPTSSSADPRLLLLEDDEVLAHRIARGLSSRYMATDTVTTLAEARAAIAAVRYQCLVLDRVVPDGDALDLVRELQQRPDRPPVVILSGFADVDRRVEGLEVGADDYLGKPTSVAELVQRVDLLISRWALAGHRATLEHGAVVFDPAHRFVTVDGEEVHLTPRQYGVFNYLMRNPHRVVSAEELLEHCWNGDRPTFSDPHRSQIAALRKLFRGYLRFEMVQGYGYVVRVDDENRVDDEGRVEDEGRGDGAGRAVRGVSR